MKKLLLVIGILLIFTGLIVFSYSRNSVETVTTQTKGSAQGKWNAFCKENITENDMIVVNVNPGRDWWMLTNPPQNPYLKIKVNLTDPLGGVTEFEVYYVRPFGDKEGILLPWNFSIISNNGALKVNENPDGTVPEIGGIAKLSGNYSVKVKQTMPWPPSAIEIFKEIKNYKQPWISLSPVGISLIVIGTFFSVVSLKKKIRKTRSSPRKRNLRKNKILRIN